MVVPNAGPEMAPLQLMKDAVDRYPIAAWKCYTQWGPEGRGFELDSPDVGIPFIERARELGVRNICIHKGLLFPGFPEEFGRCADVGRAAALYPDMNFIIYHSGYEAGTTERAYDPATATRGVDTLIKSVEDNGIGRNANVYAELGSTWRFVMRDPTTAAHLLGKLLKHIGEDNVLWGTDSIWYGSPQDQIQAFRSFQIAPALIEAHGYPELTPVPQAKGVRPQRRSGLRHRGPGAQAQDRSRSDRDAQGGLSRRGGSDVRDLRPQNRWPPSMRRWRPSAAACPPERVERPGRGRGRGAAKSKTWPDSARVVGGARAATFSPDRHRSRIRTGWNVRASTPSEAIPVAAVPRRSWTPESARGRVTVATHVRGLRLARCRYRRNTAP